MFSYYDKEELYSFLLKRTQFIVSDFDDGRESFLDTMESLGFGYKDGFSREGIIGSRYPVIVEIKDKVIWGITSSVIAGASVKTQISASDFEDFYREFYEEPAFIEDGEFARFVIEDFYHNLSRKNLNHMKKHPVPARYHFSAGLLIRNKYIYSNDNALEDALFMPDSYSHWIIGQVILKIYEKYREKSK